MKSLMKPPLSCLFSRLNRPSSLTFSTDYLIPTLDSSMFSDLIITGQRVRPLSCVPCGVCPQRAPALPCPNPGPGPCRGGAAVPGAERPLSARPQPKMAGAGSLWRVGALLLPPAWRLRAPGRAFSAAAGRGGSSGGGRLMLGAAFALGGSAGLCLAARQRLREHSAAEVTPGAAPRDPRRAFSEACGDPACGGSEPPGTGVTRGPSGSFCPGLSAERALNGLGGPWQSIP